MIHLGLTGGIASGKSAVADLLAGKGAVIVDSDVLAREVVTKGTPGLAAVVDRFGAAVLDSDGALDRAALGRLIFADVAARRDLEAIIHPAVRARAADIVRGAPADAVVVEVVPLLVEVGLAESFDLLVVVDLDPELQRERLQHRNGFSAVEAQARIAAQIDRERRLAHADVVIDNNGDQQQLQALVDKFWGEHIEPRLSALAGESTGGVADV